MTEGTDEWPVFGEVIFFPPDVLVEIQRIETERRIKEGRVEILLFCPPDQGKCIQNEQQKGGMSV